MADPNTELLAALLGHYVDRFSAVDLNRLVESLPADRQGVIYQMIKKYPSGVDLAAILQPDGLDRPGRKTTWSVDELLDTDFPDQAWLVPDLIPVGLVSLAGRPKIGKSWLALQLASAVASGGYFLGQKVERAGVLYLAFEDPGRRLKERIQKVGLQRGSPVTFKTEYRLLNDGGLDDLTIDVESGLYKLIVMDTFGRSVGQIEIKDYSENVMTLSPLQKLAQSAGVTILLIDHHGKVTGYGNNPILDLIGSIGKAATFDTVVGIYREQGKTGAKIMFVGRDQEEKDLTIDFDPLTGCWQLLGETETVRAEALKSKILKAILELKELGELPTPTRIAKNIDADIGNVGHAITDLTNEQKVIKTKKVGKEQPYDLL